MTKEFKVSRDVSDLYYQSELTLEQRVEVYTKENGLDISKCSNIRLIGEGVETPTIVFDYND